MHKEDVSRFWFGVAGNTENYYKGSPEDIIEQMKEEWCNSELD